MSIRTHVDLFSGIGGFALAARWARVETIAFAEIDPYASRVLERHFPGVRNYGDVRNVPTVDAWLVTGGVPCQPASVAGKRLGAADDRWLWPEALAAVERIRPAWVLFENPTGILSLNDGVEFERVCLALEGQGYEVQPIVIPACGVGAPHRRNRIWIVAHSTSKDARSGAREFKKFRILPDASSRSGKAAAGSNNGNVADANGSKRWSNAEGRGNEQDGDDARREKAPSRSALCGNNVSASESVSEWARLREKESRRIGERRFSDGSWWAVEPDVGRVANGIPKRVDRLRGLGNAIVPQVAYQIIKRMIEAESK